MGHYWNCFQSVQDFFCLRGQLSHVVPPNSFAVSVCFSLDPKYTCSWKWHPDTWQLGNPTSLLLLSSNVVYIYEQNLNALSAHYWKSLGFSTNVFVVFSILVIGSAQMKEKKIAPPKSVLFFFYKESSMDWTKMIKPFLAFWGPIGTLGGHFWVLGALKGQQFEISRLDHEMHSFDLNSL